MKKKVRRWIKRRGLYVVGAALLMCVWLTIYCSLLDRADQAKAEESGNVDLQPITTTQTMMLFDCPLDTELQKHIVDTCGEYGIVPEVVFAMIDQESDFDANAMGDSGNSYGLMQIQQRYHKGRMEKLGCTDLLDPYQNVQVGIDYLAELYDKYGDIEMALVAYNCGVAGAKENYFDRDQYWSVYSQEVLEQADEYLRGMIEVRYTDNPVADFERYDREQQQKLAALPVCSECGEPIQDEYFYLINGENLCEECLQDNYRKNTADFAEI